MLLRPNTLRRFMQLAVLTAVAGGLLSVTGPATAAEKTRKSIITKPKFDPEAEKVKLFDGMKDGTLEVTVIAKNEMGGNVLIENKSDKPLTVQLPDAIVGVPVLKQFGAGGQGGVGGQNNNTQNGQTNGGQNQQFGGGFGGGGLGGGGFGGGGLGGGGFGGGGGFFSVPPEKTVRVPYTSVCLNHGKPEPRPKTPYKLIPVEEYTDNEALRELIRLVGTGKVESQSAQAAAWHLTDNMSWQELSNKAIKHISGPAEPYFNRAQLVNAQSLISQAVANAKERASKEPAEAPSTPAPAKTNNPRLR
ncbi:MAG: hypothetical protein IT428_17980 [Planctomycetaceae bacterium]|nr:hypothetical protein [Planctomycetaceae bacterium]